MIQITLDEGNTFVLRTSLLRVSASRKDGGSYRTDEFLKELNLALVFIPSKHSNNEINTVSAFVVLLLTKSAYP